MPCCQCKNAETWPFVSTPATAACVTGCECQLDSNRLTFCRSSTPAAIVMYLLCSVVAVVHDGLSFSTNSLESTCWVGICAHLPARSHPKWSSAVVPSNTFKPWFQHQVHKGIRICPSGVHSDPLIAFLWRADLATTPEEAFAEAMRKIFVQKDEVHRFAMPNTSRKPPIKARWTLFEMWPINVSSSVINQASGLCQSMRGNLSTFGPHGI